jgi:O-antigen/teichoic acid export membrane protein
MATFRKLVTGTALISSVNMLRLVVQFVSLPLLARLLSPEDYGIVAMAMPILLFVMLFADSGLGVSLVRDQSAGTTAWHSCFWLTTGLGAGLCLVFAVIAPTFAEWMNEPELAAVMATLAVVILLQSLTLVPGAALQKQGLFSRVAAAEIAGVLASIGVAITLALNGFGVWALVWQQVVLYGVRLGLTAILSPYRPRFIFEWQAARGHVVFGWKLLVANAITFAGRSAESIIIGKFRGAADLGVFGMAYQFAKLPWMLVTGPLQFVLFPQVADAQNDPVRLRAQALLVSKVIATLLLAPMALIGAASVPIFDILLSEKWREAAYVFSLIIAAAAIQPVIGVLGTFVLAIGRPDVQLRLTMQATVLWMICLSGSVWYGLYAIAIAYTVSTLAFSVWSLRVMLPLLGCSFQDYSKAVGGQIILAIAAAVSYRMIIRLWEMNDLSAIILAISLASGCVLGSFIFSYRNLLAGLNALRQHSSA